MRVLRKCFVCVFLLTFNLAACISASKNDFTGTIPKGVGENEFAGKTLVSDSVKYEFNEDGTVTSYSLNFYTDSYEKSRLYAYSCDSETKTLYMIKRGYYYNDILYQNLNDYMYDSCSHTYSYEYRELLKKQLEEEKDSIEKYSYSFGDGKVSLAFNLSTKLNGLEEAFLYSPQSTDETFIFSMIWHNGGISSTSFDINYNGKNYMGSTEAFLVLFDIKASKAKVAYTYNGDVLGYGRMDYKIEKSTDTKGTIKVSFHDIDQAVIDFYESRVEKLKESPAYPQYEQALKIGAFINSKPLVLESIPPTEYEVE